MKVFISWSGQRSKETAEILSSWIRQVIQSAETWISLDIEKGARWNDMINRELEQTKIGIICLNKENLSSEWILFEAGALSKTTDAHVCTFLLDIVPSDVKPPLGQFQHTNFLKEDVKKLMHTINNKIVISGEKTLPEKDLNEIFEVFWPRLDANLNELQKKILSTQSVQRSERDILEEVLQAVRSLNKPIDYVNDFLFYFLMDNKNKGTELNKEFCDYLFENNLNSSLFKTLKYKRFSELTNRINAINEEEKAKVDYEKNERDSNSSISADVNENSKAQLPT